MNLHAALFNHSPIPVYDEDLKWEFKLMDILEWYDLEQMVRDEDGEYKQDNKRCLCQSITKRV
jgi:hypothetical protein